MRANVAQPDFMGEAEWQALDDLLHKLGDAWFSFDAVLKMRFVLGNKSRFLPRWNTCVQIDRMLSVPDQIIAATWFWSKDRIAVGARSLPPWMREAGVRALTVGALTGFGFIEPAARYLWHLAPNAERYSNWTLREAASTEAGRQAASALLLAFAIPELTPDTLFARKNTLYLTELFDRSVVDCSDEDLWESFAKVVEAIHAATREFLPE